MPSATAVEYRDRGNRSACTEMREVAHVMSLAANVTACTVRLSSSATSGVLAQSRRMPADSSWHAQPSSAVRSSSP